MSEHSSIPDRLMFLAQRCLDQTLQGVISWRTTDDINAFLFSGSKTSIIIDLFPQSSEYEFRIVNDRGVIVEELLRAPQPDADDPWVTDTQTKLRQQYEILEALHDAARRSALNIDELLDSALDDVISGFVEQKPPF